MADYFPGQIEIGGEVPSRLVKGLCKQIRLQGVSLDYGGEHFEPTGAQDLLYAAQGGTLKTCDPEARFGQFEELEAWLARHGIAFSRHSDVKHEFDAENVEFRPGMKEPKVVGSNQDEVATVSQPVLAEDVYPLLEQGRAAEALSKFKELVGDDIPPLEPLSIGG